MKIEPWGYVVIDAAEEWEQILALEVGPGLPEHGILTWSQGRKNRVFFATRERARAAIDRTEHYRKAFGRTNLPEKRNCRIEIIAAVHPEAA